MFNREEELDLSVRSSRMWIVKRGGKSDSFA